MTALESTIDMYDLRMSDKAKPLYEAVKKFIAEEVEPNTAEFFRLGEGRAEISDEARQKILHHNAANMLSHLAPLAQFGQAAE